MTFSTALYQQNIAPAQQDARLSAPLMKQQVDGLASVFKGGLDLFSYVLEKKEQQKKQMAAIVQASDKRAAQLAASGISSQDAINMAWEESRHMVPKTWGDVSKQNAISDLASKANNGWTGGQSSAIVIETAMADLQAIQQHGIDGVPLEDLSWTNGDGLKKLVAATRPKPETMIALGPNGTWVRNQILDRAIHIADTYTEKERQKTDNQFIQNGVAQMNNLLKADLNGDPIPPYVASYVENFIEKNPAEAKKGAIQIIKQMAAKTSYDGSINDGYELLEKLQPFGLRFGEDTTSIEYQKFVVNEADAGNQNRLTETKENAEDFGKALAKLSLEEKLNRPLMYQLMLDNGFTPEEIETTTIDDEAIANDPEIEAIIRDMTIGIRNNQTTVAQGFGVINRLGGDSMYFRNLWGDQFYDAERAAINQAKTDAREAERSAREARSEIREELKPMEGLISKQIERKFSHTAPIIVNGEIKNFKQDVSELTKAIIDGEWIKIRRMIIKKKVSEEEGIEMFNNLVEVKYGGLLKDPNSFLQIDQPEITNTTTSLMRGMGVR